MSTLTSSTCGDCVHWRRACRLCQTGAAQRLQWLDARQPMPTEALSLRHRVQAQPRRHPRARRIPTRGFWQINLAERKAGRPSSLSLTVSAQACTQGSLPPPGLRTRPSRRACPARRPMAIEEVGNPSTRTRKGSASPDDDGVRRQATQPAHRREDLATQPTSTSSRLRRRV